MNAIKDINIGDLLYRSKGLVQHVGVYLGDNIVIHNSPIAGIQEVSFEVFSESKVVKIERVELKSISILIEQLEIMRCSTMKYSVLGNNCEKFARELLGKRPCSPQINAVIAGAAAGALVSVVAEKNLWLSILIGGGLALTLSNANKKYDGMIAP